MFYTAYNGSVAQIAQVHIKADDFLARRWSKWSKRIYPFPGVNNKDVVLFPEKIKGNVANVVFTCGALLKGERVFVYYGGADKVICVATQMLEELLP